MIHYSHNVENAKKLRKNMTPWERKLWYLFLKDYTFRFQRQKCIGEFIVDFYCHQAKLVVELDGSQHYEPQEQEYDRIRTSYLETQGMKVLRFSNLDVDRQFYSICEIIHQTVEERIEQKP